MEACIALSAYHLVTVVFLGQDPERGFDDSSSETENQVEGGLLLDVVVRQGSPVLKLEKNHKSCDPCGSRVLG